MEFGARPVDGDFRQAVGVLVPEGLARRHIGEGADAGQAAAAGDQGRIHGSRRFNGAEGQDHAGDGAQVPEPGSWLLLALGVPPSDAEADAEGVEFLEGQDAPKEPGEREEKGGPSQPSEKTQELAQDQARYKQCYVDDETDFSFKGRYESSFARRLIAGAEEGSTATTPTLLSCSR